MNFRMFKKNKSKGIIALFPAIILSSILLVLSIMASSSILNQLYRATIFEDKIQADILAQVCVQRVKAKLNQDLHYVDGEELHDLNCSADALGLASSSVRVHFGKAYAAQIITGIGAF